MTALKPPGKRFTPINVTAGISMSTSLTNNTTTTAAAANSAVGGKKTPTGSSRKKTPVKKR